jgi:hypothetical protein
MFLVKTQQYPHLPLIRIEGLHECQQFFLSKDRQIETGGLANDQVQKPVLCVDHSWKIPFKEAFSEA